MPEILFTAQWPDGTPRAHQKIAVVLIDGGAGGSHGDDMIGDTIPVTLDATGQAVAQLVGVDQVDPPGCHYRCTLVGSSPSLVRRITPVASTPDGTSWADPSILAISPVPPAWVPLEGPQGDPGPVGAAGPPAADMGLLAARPAAAPAGTLYTATDDQGGTLYVTDGATWSQAAPSVDATSGRILASVWPTSVATQTADGTGAVVWPEMVSASVPWPTSPVRVLVPRMALAFAALPAPASFLHLRVEYKVDAGPWRHAKMLVATPDETRDGSGPVAPRVRSGAILAEVYGDAVRVPWPGATSPDDVPDPGDSVQFRVSAGGFPASHTGIGLTVFTLFGAYAGFDVVAL